MSSDALAAVVFECRSCGLEFWTARPERGPMRGYCSGRCRQAAYRARVHQERATVVADLALSASHARLAGALAVLSPSSVARLQDVLTEPADRNLSPSGRDGLCSAATTAADAVVVPLHNQEG